jgi:hypothetical protein
MKFDIGVFFQKSVEKIPVSLKSDKNNGYLCQGLCAFVFMSVSVLLRMRNVSISKHTFRNTHSETHTSKHISKHTFRNTHSETHIPKHTLRNTFRNAHSETHFETHIPKYSETHSETFRNTFRNTHFETHIPKHIFETHIPKHTFGNTRYIQ